MSDGQRTLRVSKGDGMITWAQEQRLLWIAEMLDIYGFINRGHIVKKFRVSVPQASADMGMVCRNVPMRILYNPKTKQYEKIQGNKSPKAMG